MRTSENSSDLERAAAARSIAVEFLEVRMAIEKLQRCENQYFSRSRCTFWDPDSFLASAVAASRVPGPGSRLPRPAAALKFLPARSQKAKYIRRSNIHTRTSTIEVKAQSQTCDESVCLCSHPPLYNNYCRNIAITNIVRRLGAAPLPNKQVHSLPRP